MAAQVPELVRGAWQRVSIHNADGTSDTTSTVVWLQLESLMADIRISADQFGLADRGSLDACSLDDLSTLAQSESSSGYTTCTDLAVGPGGQRTATAQWFTRDHGNEFGVGFQPVTAYPEPGMLEWNADGSVMIERAPSGAYTEEWHRMAGTAGPLSHRVLDDGRQIYRAGSVAVLVRDRMVAVPRPARLDDLITEAGNDHATIAQLVDCEFSLVQLGDDGWRITASTLPWRVGDTLEDMDNPNQQDRDE